MFDGEHGLALHAVQGNQASSRGEGKSHSCSPIAVGTWGIFSNYNGTVPAKLVFVQRQNSCLAARDTSEFSSRLGRAIGMLLEVRGRPSVPFQLPQ